MQLTQGMATFRERCEAGVDMVVQRLLTGTLLDHPCSLFAQILARLPFCPWHPRHPSVGDLELAWRGKKAWKPKPGKTSAQENQPRAPRAATEGGAKRRPQAPKPAES